MKKVAILTITNSGLNFGNRLQNYALQEALKTLGVEVETIQSAKSLKGSKVLSATRRMVKNIVRNDKRRRYFKNFNKQYINFASKVRYENINEQEFADKYDSFVAGSDQVWNPNFHFNSDFEFASFAPESKRFSYAASIGVSDIKEEHMEEFVRCVNGMRVISVRENDSIDLIKQLIGRDANVHIDPTMLLDEKIYSQIEEMPPQGLPEKYMLTYFLGNMPEEYQKKIEQLAQQLHLEIVRLSESKGTKYYHIGPQHFLYAIRHADFICTDSFHGSVFSILFQKQFSIFKRTDKDVPMNSRIETLVNKFKLQDRVMGNMDIENAKKTIDYQQVNIILQQEKDKAYTYLKEISKMW